MITISRPRIETKGNKAVLIADITDETRDWKAPVWYETEREYEPYLCTETADAFLLMLLPIAVKTEQNIRIETAISAKLYFNITNTLEPFYRKYLGASKQVCIEAKTLVTENYQAKGVGCGCSLGVDSLASIFLHSSNDVPQEYKVTHIALFNSGQLGDYDLKHAEQNFRDSVEEIRPFAQDVNLPIISVNSNLNDFYRYSGVMLLQSYPLRTLSCAMALQKLLGKYVYGAGHTIDAFSFGNNDVSAMESAIVPLLSTESFTAILSTPMATRVEKTDYIRKSPLATRYLKVCWAEQTAYEIWHNTTFLEGKTKVNCGWCDKCLRTLLTLEILQGDVNMYGQLFELSKYEEHKADFLRKVIMKQDTNPLYKEIVNLIAKKNYKVPEDILKEQLKIQRHKKIKEKLKKLIDNPKALPKKLYWHFFK